MQMWQKLGSQIHYVRNENFITRNGYSGHNMEPGLNGTVSLNGIGQTQSDRLGTFRQHSDSSIESDILGVSWWVHKTGLCLSDIFPRQFYSLVYLLRQIKLNNTGAKITRWLVLASLTLYLNMYLVTPTEYLFRHYPARSISGE